MGRAPCCDKGKVKRGPWSPDEDNLLRNYLHNHGTAGNWIALPRKAGLRRCGKSCRLRWLNYLRPDIKHGGFTQEEDNIICSLYSTIGSRWSVIAARLPGRTDNDVKNYWNTKLKKKLLAGKVVGLHNIIFNNNTTNNNYNQITTNSNSNSAQIFPAHSLLPAVERTKAGPDGNDQSNNNNIIANGIGTTTTTTTTTTLLSSSYMGMADDHDHTIKYHNHDDQLLAAGLMEVADHYYSSTRSNAMSTSSAQQVSSTTLSNSSISNSSFGVDMGMEMENSMLLMSSRYAINWSGHGGNAEVDHLDFDFDFDFDGGIDHPVPSFQDSPTTQVQFQVQVAEPCMLWK